MKIRGPRFSVQVLLLGVMLTALCLAGWNGYSAWYRQQHGDEVLNNQLHRIRNGDSLEVVTSRLGVEGVNIDEDPTLGPDVARFTRERYGQRESGLDDADQLLTFSVGKYGVTLQFRDGQIINHDPSEYHDVGLPISVSKLRDTPLGRQLLQLRWQMGAPQVVAGVVTVGALLFAVIMARKRSYSTSSLKSIVALPAFLGTFIVCVAARVEPSPLSLVIAGFAGAVAWNLVGQLAKGQGAATTEAGRSMATSSEDTNA